MNIISYARMSLDFRPWWTKDSITEYYIQKSIFISLLDNYSTWGGKGKIFKYKHPLTFALKVFGLIHECIHKCLTSNGNANVIYWHRVVKRAPQLWCRWQVTMVDNNYLCWARNKLNFVWLYYFTTKYTLRQFIVFRNIKC